jgi:signal transduction histidine kinase
MNEIHTLIEACAWAPSHLMVFSDNVYSPFLYYTYFASAVPALLVALFVFLHQRKSLVSRLLLLMNVALAMWIVNSLIVWASPNPGHIMFFWTFMNICEVFVYFFAFYLSYVFLTKRDLTTAEKYTFVLPLLPTIILAPTTLMLVGFDLTNCDRNAVEGVLSLYGYAAEMFYVGMIAAIALKTLVAHDSPLKEARRVAVLFSIGILAFLLAFSLGNILELVTENTEIGQYGLLGAPVMSALMAYIIVKFKAFDVKLFSIHAFMAALWLMVFSLLFIRESDNANLIILFTLLAFGLLARPLSRSIAEEITGRKEKEQLADDLKNANDRLQDLDRTKSEFVSIASHQLRTPLTAIRGFAELMRDGTYGVVPPPFQEPLSHIEESVQNMAMTINDFLNVSRIESGTMKYEMSVFSLRELAEKISNELRQYATKRNLLLVYEAKTESPLVVTADEGKVRQILQNLIDNSIKYTPQGSITIRAELVPTNVARISIVDTGIGMSTETQRVIFDKFVRASNANTTNIYGTGLGLYIAKQMADAMHGTVGATSWGEGQGSTCTLELPLSHQTPGELSQ